MSFHPQLLPGILLCTRSRSPLLKDGDSLICADETCRLRFGIVDGIPNMLVEEASELPLDEWQFVIDRAKAALHAIENPLPEAGPDNPETTPAEGSIPCSEPPAS